MTEKAAAVSTGEFMLLRVEIRGQWAVQSMGSTLSCLSDLYEMRWLLGAIASTLAKSGREGRVARWLMGEWFENLRGLGVGEGVGTHGLGLLLDPRHDRAAAEGRRFRLWRLRYESPGFVDVVGLGVVIGHLKDLILGLMDRVEATPRNRLEEDRLRLENAEKYVALVRTIGELSERDLRGLVSWVDVRQGPVIEVIRAGLVGKVSSEVVDAEDVRRKP